MYIDPILRLELDHSKEVVEPKTWCLLWSRKDAETRLKNSRSIHPRNWSKAKPEVRA